jgi:hypothetical protein
MSGFSDRIKQLIENEGLNGNKLSKILNYPRSQTAYDVINGKTFPSFDFFFRLFSSEIFDKYDPIWLITGKGNMLKSEKYGTVVAENLNKSTSDYEPNMNNEMEEQLKFLRELAAERGEEIKQLRREIERLRNGDNFKKGGVADQ